MNMVGSEIPDHALELRSLVTDQGTLELSLADVTPPTIVAGQVLVLMEAAPINPSGAAGSDRGYCWRSHVHPVPSG